MIWIRRKDSSMDTQDGFPGQTQSSLEASDSLNIVVLGVCVGSGLTEVDCALLRFSQKAPNTTLRISLLQYDVLPVPAIIRTGVLELLHSAKPTHATMSRANGLLGHLFSSGIKTFCRKHDVRLSAIHLVGTHANIPNRTRRLGAHNADTHPYGWNKAIAAETGITTVFEFKVIERGDFRPRIPPTAFAYRTVLTHKERFRVCLNIDDLASLTFIPPSANQDASRTQFCDCGPGNLFIDYAVRYYTANGTGEDHSGYLAAQGTINQGLVDVICTDRYLQTKPYLSMATEMFGDHEAQHLIDECLARNMDAADAVATITRIIARNILNQYRRSLEERFPAHQQVDELFICGRGARNPNIIDYLESELPESVITRPLDDIGIPGDANKAVCYAHLAFETIRCRATRRPASAQTELSPSTMLGAHYVGGKVVCGTERDALVAHILRFSKGEQLYAASEVRVMKH